MCFFLSICSSPLSKVFVFSHIQNATSINSRIHPITLTETVSSSRPKNKTKWRCCCRETRWFYLLGFASSCVSGQAILYSENVVSSIFQQHLHLSDVLTPTIESLLHGGNLRFVHYSRLDPCHRDFFVDLINRA